MFRKFKGIMIGIILGAMFSGTVAVATGNTTTLYDVLTTGIRIVIDGQELHPADANGNKVEPMIYNGTTYLPVRAVASALGKAVYWDGPNYTVYLGDMDGELEYPTVMMTDMVNISGNSLQTANWLTDNYGNRYSSAVFNYYTTYEYLLNMKYSRFKGTLYMPEGDTGTKGIYLTVKADGHVIYTSPTMTKTSAPVDIDIDVTGYNDLVIEWNSRYTSYGTNYSVDCCCLADAGFYQ